MANNRTNDNRTKQKTKGQATALNKVTKKNTAQKNRTNSRGTKNKNTSGKNADSIPMSNEITLVVSFGLVVLMMFSNFGHCGMVGKWLASFFFGIFGCAQYVMPIAFFFGITILIANDYSTLAMKKCGAGFIILMTVSACAQLLYKKSTVTIHDLFSLAINDHTTGGIIGGGIGLLLKNGFGMAGAMVILFCIFLLACILLTQKSFVSFFKKIVIDIKKAVDEWKKASQKQKMEREAAVAEDHLIDLEETEETEHSGEKAKSFLKMKNAHKKSTDKVRAKQCEEKVKELEKKKEQKGKEKSVKNLKVNLPLFTSSDEVKRKDCVKELHPRVYPFTEEDGKTEPFRGELDFSAFSFPGEENIEKKTIEEEKKMEFEAPHKTKGAFRASLPEEIKINNQDNVSFSDENIKETDETSELITEESMDNIVSEAEVLSEEDISAPTGNETIEKNTIEKAIKQTEEPEKMIVEQNAEKQSITKESVVVPDREKAEGEDYIFPPSSLLVKEKQTQSSDYEQYLKETAIKLQQTLESFGVNVTITDISCGPSVTRYEMFPEQGTKVSKILSLTDDIKLNLAASDIRIEAPIPGKAAIGIEIPNKHNQTVHFRDLIESHTFKHFKSKLAFAVGKDIGGKIVVTDLAKMPHLLIAGATGSGKSVCINTLIMSILYKASPEEVKLIMVDPKMVELSIYNGIPHLLIPVVTDPKKASGALNWAVAEMTNRYKKFTETGVRNIEGYNKKVIELQKSGEVDPGTIKKMSQIVIIIDELADLMMVAPGEVEDAIVRLSQLARAAGIHLVIATQRPSVNVITGLIKANVPSRIAFSVSSGVDSRTIIDMNGAEKLLGKGDMLFYPAGYSKPIRVQGAFVSDNEINDVVKFLKENEDVAVYDAEVTEKIESKLKTAALSQERDEYFEAAARFVVEKDKASIGMLQRMFKVGFNRAARIVDQLADAGIVGPEEGTKPRKVLMSSEQLDTYFEEYL